MIVGGRGTARPMSAAEMAKLMASSHSRLLVPVMAIRIPARGAPMKVETRLMPSLAALARSRGILARGARSGTKEERAVLPGA